jgi:hypothetical protein
VAARRARQHVPDHGDAGIYREGQRMGADEIGLFAWVRLLREAFLAPHRDALRA